MAIVKSVWFVAVQKHDGTVGKIHIRDPRKVRQFNSAIFPVVHWHLIRYDLHVEEHEIKLVGPIEANEYYYPRALIVEKYNLDTFGAKAAKYRAVMEKMGWQQMLVANNGGMFEYRPEFMFVV